MPAKQPIVVKPKINIKNNIRRRRRRRNRKKNRKIKSRNVPIAIATRFRKPNFRRLRSKTGEQYIVMTGTDLVLPVPEFDPENGGQEIFLSIPANPLYWKGTRLAGIAKVYQQYRPLKFDVEYVPQVPVTFAGQVIYGTIWNNGVPFSELQQSLATSNGGGLTTCYQRAHSHVLCNQKTLPFKYYNVHDNMTENSTCPFYWHACYTGANKDSARSPGYVLLHWKYAFNTGLGDVTRDAAVINQTTQAVIKDNEDYFSSSNILPTVGWGVVLGLLKSKTIKLLRKIAILVLTDVLADLNDGSKTKISAGTLINYTQQDVATANTNTSQLEMNGTYYTVSDDSKVAVYMTGQPIERQIDPTPPEPEISYGPLAYGMNFLTLYGNQTRDYQNIQPVSASAYDDENPYQVVQFTYNTPGQDIKITGHLQIDFESSRTEIYIKWNDTIPEQTSITVQFQLSPYSTLSGSVSSITIEDLQEVTGEVTINAELDTVFHFTPTTTQLANRRELSIS